MIDFRCVTESLFRTRTKRPDARKFYNFFIFFEKGTPLLIYENE